MEKKEYTVEKIEKDLEIPILDVVFYAMHSTLGMVAWLLGRISDDKPLMSITFTVIELMCVINAIRSLKSFMEFDTDFYIEKCEKELDEKLDTLDEEQLETINEAFEEMQEYSKTK